MTAPAAAGAVARSREERAAAERPIREGRRRRSTLRRQTIGCRSLALADTVAASLALALCVGVLSDTDSLYVITLLALPLMVVAGKIQRIYERGELVLNKSTIDEAPNLFELASVYALIVYVFDDALLSGPLGSAQVLLLWFTLFFFARDRPLDRPAARTAYGGPRTLPVRRQRRVVRAPPRRRERAVAPAHRVPRGSPALSSSLRTRDPSTSSARPRRAASRSACCANPRCRRRGDRGRSSRWRDAGPSPPIGLSRSSIPAQAQLRHRESHGVLTPFRCAPCRCDQARFARTGVLPTKARWA